MSMAKDKPTEIRRRGHDVSHLREWRMIQGVNQKLLVQLTGISRQSMSKLENGENFARNETVDKLAAALHLPSDVLLSDPDDLSMDELKKYNPVLYRRIVSQLQRQAVTGEVRRETFTA